MRQQQFAQVGDIGVQIVVTVLDENGLVVNVSGADAIQLRLERPDGTTMDQAAVLYSDGTDGKIAWTTTRNDDLNQAGMWQVQGTVTIAGQKKSTRLGSFWVYNNIDSN